MARGLGGACLAANGDRPAAEAELLASLEGLQGDSATRKTLRKHTLRWLVQLYEAWDRPAEAEKFRMLLSTS
jgi:hypothetical protein